MTVIAYKDGVMAADGQVTSDGTIMLSNEVKCFYKDGHVFGVAGLFGEALILQKWFTNGMKGDPPTITSETEGMLVSPDGIVYGLWEHQMMVPLENRDFYVIGSGFHIATGAMEMGASAIKAVEIAIKYSIYCGGEITSHKIGRKDK